MTRWLQAARGETAARTEPTEPTKPLLGLFEAAPNVSATGVPSVSSVLSEGEGPDADELEALDAFEERAAILEHDGGQLREATEAAALAEVAHAAGIALGALQRLWADHPDTRTYLAFLVLHGPATVGAAGSALGWGATRAWQAEARLRAAGLVSLEPLGKARLVARLIEG